jgi:hypothetical protein
MIMPAPAQALYHNERVGGVLAAVTLKGNPLFTTISPSRDDIGTKYSDPSLSAIA